MPSSYADTCTTLVDTVAASPRRQPYRFIHKALRALMCRTLAQVATLDAARADDRNQLLTEVDEMLLACAEHAMQEGRHFHGPLSERAPRAAQPFDDDHHEQDAAVAALRHRLSRLAHAGGAEAREQAHALYLALSRFVGEQLEHMADEETQLTQALWQHFADDEIVAMENRQRSALCAEELAYYQRWMARGLNDDELLRVAVGARADLPLPAFDALVDRITGEIDPARGARLRLALGWPGPTGV